MCIYTHTLYIYKAVVVMFQEACWKVSPTELILLSDEAKCLGTPDSSTSYYTILPLTFLDPCSLTRNKVTLSPSYLESLMQGKSVKCLTWRDRE